MKKVFACFVLGITIVLFLALGAMGIAGASFTIANLFGRPQPLYDVQSYEELADVIKEYGQIPLPDSQLVAVEDGQEGRYTVYLVNRFKEEPSGYGISVIDKTKDKITASVHCDLIRESVVYEFNPNEEYRGTQVEAYTQMLKFNYNGYFFTISGPNKEYCYQMMDSILDYCE